MEERDEGAREGERKAALKRKAEADAGGEGEEGVGGQDDGAGLQKIKKEEEKVSPAKWKRRIEGKDKGESNGHISRGDAQSPTGGKMGTGDAVKREVALPDEVKSQEQEIKDAAKNNEGERSTRVILSGSWVEGKAEPCRQRRERGAWVRVTSKQAGGVIINIKKEENHAGETAGVAGTKDSGGRSANKAGSRVAGTNEAKVGGAMSGASNGTCSCARADIVWLRGAGGLTAPASARPGGRDAMGAAATAAGKKVPASAVRIGGAPAESAVLNGTSENQLSPLDC